MSGRDADIAILGGGLAGGLTALALAIRRPDLRLLLVESGETFGGNHVWSFFQGDIAGSHRWLIDPLVVSKWPRHEVRFPRFSRNLSIPYRSVTSERLDAVLREQLPAEALLTGAQVVNATRTGFTLADGREFAAGAVIDARGTQVYPHLAGGWQKFVGQTLRFAKPHGLGQPIIMDARISQRDGFRFVYCLPFSPDTLLVEDTYYSTDPEIDRDKIVANIAEYCQMATWDIAEVLREEQGVLPVVAAGDFTAFRAVGSRSLPTIGARAGLFHPLTGYSLPKAVETALMIVALPEMSAATLARACEAHAQAHWRDTRYYRHLAKMLFGAARPRRRYKVFERFYRLDAELISRFYAGTMFLGDKLRVLMGKPPVPISRALVSLFGGGLPLARLDRLAGDGGEAE